MDILQSDCGFCKHNLLRLPPSVSSMHQQPCFSDQHTHTHTHTRTLLHSQEQTERSMDSRGGGESYYTCCLFLVRYLPGPRSRYWNSRRALWLSNFCAFPFPKSRSIICLGLSSWHLTRQLDIPLKLTVWSKETKKLKRAFPWWLGCNNTTAKLNHFSFLASACQCLSLPLSLSLSICLFPIQIQVLTLLAENCPIWFDRYSVLEALARLAIVLALALASLNAGGPCTVSSPPIC